MALNEYRPDRDLKVARPISANSLEGTLERLQGCVTTSNDLVDKITEIADRLIGTENKEGKPGNAGLPQEPFASGLLGELQRKEHALRLCENQIAYQLGRIAGVVL